jgi:hypothetical protein
VARFERLAREGSPARRGLWALAIYVTLTAIYLCTAGAERLADHTPFNHFALQAEAWLAGRLDLGGPPPDYTFNNDFALHDGKHYVSFPPVPAALLVPFVALAGSAEALPDGLVFVLLGALAPALLFLALEKLRLRERHALSEPEDAALALLFGLGTVYWFSAVQGTVWFAAHALGTTLIAGYLWASIGATRPILAGIFLALAAGTRPTLAFALPFFALELWQEARDAHPDDGRARSRHLARRAAAFALPIAVCGSLYAWHNAARFGDPFEFGHRMLTVVWRERIDRSGLFSLRYLGRNLAVVLTGMPFFTPAGMKVNAHGLALWITSPFFLWALWPRRASLLFWGAALAAALVALPSLFYQNTGWLQFGYRFSNDFAPFLFVMIAAGGRRLGVGFWLAGAFAIAVNAFGAVTFDRAEYARFYFVDRTQRVLHQPE